MVVLSGAPEDKAAVDAAAAAARPFGAELAAVYAPADAADLMPLIGEGFMSGMQVAAFDSLAEAAALGERRAKEHAHAAGYRPTTFTALGSPVREGLSMEARLADLVAVAGEAALGRSPLSYAFQMLLMDERRPVLVARGGLSEPVRRAVVAWDGGREATRAARAAIPWLRTCGPILLLSAPEATARTYDPARLVALFAERGVEAEVEVLTGDGDPGHSLLDAAKAAGADLLVAGAFGHPRFQEVIFGGTTRHLIQAKDAPSLFLAH